MAWLEKRDGTWFIAYRDQQGKTNRLRASTDKLVAKGRLADFEKAQARGEDYSDPFKNHRGRPITEHVKDYMADLRALGRDGMYIYNVEKRLNRLIDACGWKVAGDIIADSFCAWREKPVKQKSAQSEDRTIGPVTMNQHLEAVRAFCRWCVKRKRIASNPLADVVKMDESQDVRRARRALTVEQIADLLAVVPEQYQMVYRFMLTTGLRRQEVVDLQWGDVHLDATTPYLQLRAKATKSRRADGLPLRSDIAQELRDMRGDAGDGVKVFVAVPSIDQHKAFLEKAGIPFEDEEGRRADIHALRHTYGTLLSQAGVSPRMAMELMRHTDMRLTMTVYTDPRIFDLAGAVEKLSLPPVEQTTVAVATGTDGGQVQQSATGEQGANRVATATFDRQLVATNGNRDAAPDVPVRPDNGGDWQQKTPSGRDGGKAGDLGFEPRQTDPESVVLPLHQSPNTSTLL
jgi:integrase